MANEPIEVVDVETISPDVYETLKPVVNLLCITYGTVKTGSVMLEMLVRYFGRDPLVKAIDAIQAMINAEQKQVSGS